MSRGIASWLVIAAFGTARGAPIVYHTTPHVFAQLPGIGPTVGLTVVSHASDRSGYQPWFSLERGNLEGFHFMRDGDWLFSFSIIGSVAGKSWQTRDVVRCNPSRTRCSCFCSAEVLEAPGAFDALYLEDDGRLVVSFDEPTTIGDATYDKADLVALVRTGRECTDWKLGDVVFDATANGIPAHINLAAADLYEGRLILSFDDAITPRSSEFEPNDLVSFDPTTGEFALFYRDPDWPANHPRGDIAFGLVGGGTVPDGQDRTTPLRAELHRGNGTLTLTWGPSCDASETDYEVYEGPLVRPWAYGHGPRSCSTEGRTRFSLQAPVASSYYLVVPRTAIAEGSYGRSFPDRRERPQGENACVPQALPASCP